MSEPNATPAPAAATAVPSADANGQLIVSLAIVVVLGLIALALVIAGTMTGKWDVLAGGIGAAIGALATALNAPSGLSNVLRAASTPPPPPSAS